MYVCFDYAALTRSSREMRLKENQNALKAVLECW